MTFDNKSSREDRLKIAHLTTVDLSLRYLVFPQLLAMRDLGAEAIGISAPGTHVPHLEAAGIRHIPLPSSTRGINVLADLRAARQLWRVLRRERFDVLHTHNPKPGVYGRVLGRLAGVPVVVNTVHGLYATPDDRLVKRVVVYLLEAIASRFSDIELMQSAEDYELVTRWRITRPSRTRLLGNGVDLIRFDRGRFDASVRAGVRKELGVGDEAVVVGMVGRLVAEKGYPELFEAMRLLDSRFSLVCIGPDDPDKSDALPRELVEAAKRAGVQFLGMRTDVDRLYTGMDLFVLPSHREGFPRAAMEAAAMGLPVIATDIRGCREVVEPRSNGLLVPVGDAAALAEAIELVGSHPELRLGMSAAAITRARERFDETTVVTRVVQAYAEASARKGVVWPSRSSEPSPIRRAHPGDAAQIARLHAHAIDTGFLPRLGQRFLTLLYRAMTQWEGATVLVTGSPGVVGFAAGVEDTGRFYRYFLRRWGPAAFLVALPHLLRPSVLVRAFETLRYQGDEDIRAELLAMAVHSSNRGKGIGRRLGTELLAAMAGAGAAVRVVVGASNQRAISLYESLGFARRAKIEVHAGEPSLEMVWSASA